MKKLFLFLFFAINIYALDTMVTPQVFSDYQVLTAAQLNENNDSARAWSKHNNDSMDGNFVRFTDFADSTISIDTAYVLKLKSDTANISVLKSDSAYIPNLKTDSTYVVKYMGIGIKPSSYELKIVDSTSSAAINVQTTSAAFNSAIYFGTDNNSLASHIIAYGSASVSSPNSMRLTSSYGVIDFYSGTGGGSSKIMTISRDTGVNVYRRLTSNYGFFTDTATIDSAYITTLSTGSFNPSVLVVDTIYSPKGKIDTLTSDSIKSTNGEIDNLTSETAIVESDASGDFVMEINNVSSTGSGLEINAGGTGGTSEVALKIDNYAGSVNLMSVLGNGKIGMGTINPLSDLHVIGSIRASDTVFNDISQIDVLNTDTANIDTSNITNLKADSLTFNGSHYLKNYEFGTFQCSLYLRGTYRTEQTGYYEINGKKVIISIPSLRDTLIGTSAAMYIRGIPESINPTTSRTIVLRVENGGTGENGYMINNDSGDFTRWNIYTPSGGAFNAGYNSFGSFGFTDCNFYRN